MISTRQAGELLDLTPHRIKQLLNENKNLNFEQRTNGNRQINIPSETMANLLKLRSKAVVPKKCVIKSQKGGVGGTTLTLMTAIRAAQRGAKVLVWDLDPESMKLRWISVY
jgi:Mrp family chromosome partitioning ATPase